jgi:hypothetical protein
MVQPTIRAPTAGRHARTRLYGIGLLSGGPCSKVAASRSKARHAKQEIIKDAGGKLLLETTRDACVICILRYRESGQGYPASRELFLRFTRLGFVSRGKKSPGKVRSERGHPPRIQLDMRHQEPELRRTMTTIYFLRHIP